MCLEPCTLNIADHGVKIFAYSNHIKWEELQWQLVLVKIRYWEQHAEYCKIYSTHLNIWFRIRRIFLTIKRSLRLDRTATQLIKWGHYSYSLRGSFFLLFCLSFIMWLRLYEGFHFFFNFAFIRFYNSPAQHIIFHSWNKKHNQLPHINIPRPNRSDWWIEQMLILKLTEVPTNAS